jgi:hypothetical protein
MNPLWTNALKWAMPVIIEAGSSFYKKQSSTRQERHTPGSADSQAEQVEALKSAMIRIAEEMEVSNRKQAELARAVTRVRWITIAVGVLAILALVIALWK